MTQLFRSKWLHFYCQCRKVSMALTKDQHSLGVDLRARQGLVVGVTIHHEVLVHGLDFELREVGDGREAPGAAFSSAGGDSWRREAVHHETHVGGGVGVLRHAANGDNVADFCVFWGGYLNRTWGNWKINILY